MAVEAAGSALVAEIIKNVTKPVIDAATLHVGYLVNYNSNIKGLIKGVEELNSTRVDAENNFKSATNNNEDETETSRKWRASAEAAEKAANEVIKIDTEKPKTGCLSNCYPNPLQRYRLSKKAAKKAEEIQKLQIEGKPYVPLKRTADPPAELPGALANHDSEGFETRVTIMNDIMKALKDDEISILGVCGLGGVGKTTLMHELRETAKVDGLFDEVAFAVVSRDPDLSKIQRTLAKSLGLTLEADDDIIAAADKLHKRLTGGRRTLVILDDIWNEINLKELGIPVKSGQTRCKVIFTSRQVGVCTQMNAHKTIRVDIMPQEEAWELFKKKAGNHMKSDVEEIAKEVAAECGGLPIALVTLAKALSNKKDVKTWKDALKKLQGHNGSSIPGMEKNVYMSITMSIEFLARELPEAKPLFLLCCQHQEDYEIEVEMLARYCLALRLLENVDKIEEARNRVSSLIEYLTDCSLLEATAADDVTIVTMHDVVRDVGLSIVSIVKEQPDRVYMQIEKQATDEGADITVVKILQMENLRVFESYRDMDLDQLRAVEVQKNLRMLYLYKAKLDEAILSKIGGLLEMEILSFRECEIGPFPRQIFQLSNLKLLDLRSSDEESQPIPGGMLPKLKKLEDLYLGKYNFLRTPEEGESHGHIEELEKLCNLRTLQIQLLHPMQLLDLKHLFLEKLQRFFFKMLSTVDDSDWEFCDMPEGGTVDDSDLIGRSLDFRGSSITWILGDEFQTILRRIEKLELRSIDDWTDPLILEKFASLTDLTLSKCEDLEYLFPGDGAYMTGSKLEELRVESMSCLTELCQKGNLQAGMLGKLTRLFLKGMSRLRHLWLGPTDRLFMVNLRDVHIERCGALKYIFPHSVVKCLVQLKTLIVSECGMLEGIVSEGDHETATDLILHFPKLKELIITRSSNLRGFYAGDSRVQPLWNPSVLLPSVTYLQVCGLDQLKQIVGGGTPDIPNLRSVCVQSCDSLETVFEFEGLEVMGEDAHPMVLGELQEPKLWELPKLEQVCGLPPKGIHAFRNVTSLWVDSCRSLSCLFSSSVAQMLVHLEDLQVKNCKSMKECIEDNGRKKIVFPSLKCIELEHLEKLSSFCSSDQLELEFPSLEKVSIIVCPEMKTFCYGRAVAEKLHGENFAFTYKRHRWDEEFHGVKFASGDKLDWKSDLNPTIQHAYKVMVEILELHGSGECKVIGPTGTIEFQNTQISDVVSCDSLESVFEFGGKQFMAENELGNLKDIRLIELPKLTRLCHFRMLDISIPVPQIITVDDSAKLGNFGTLKLLQKFKNIWIDCCESLEAVFDFEGLEVTSESSFFGELQEIKLKSLPKLEHICTMAPIEIDIFQNLTTLIVQRCGSLGYLISSSMAQMLEKLEYLSISRCDSMKEVIPMNEVYGRKKIVFRSLRTISLEHLKKLSSFCSSDQLEFDFPSLEEVNISYCHEMKMFCYGRLTAEKLDGVKFCSDGNLDWKSDLNQTVQHFNKVMVEILELRGSGGCKVIGPMGTIEFQNTQISDVVSCDSLESVFEFGGNQFMVENELGNLKGIRLIELRKLTRLCHFRMLDISIPVPLTITVDDSAKLGNFGTLKLLQKFKIIRISCCKSLEAVFDFEGLEVTSESSLFGELQEIELSELPKLEHICRMMAPIEIHVFQNLTSLYLYKCGSLGYVISSSIAQMLEKLEYLDISQCDSVKEVITMNEVSGRKKIVFRSLRSILLRDLEKLSSFCSSDQLEFEFPSLERVSIHECPGMKTFCYGHAVAEKLHEVTFSYGEEPDWRSDLNQTVIHHFNKGTSSPDASSNPGLIESVPSASIEQPVPSSDPKEDDSTDASSDVDNDDGPDDVVNDFNEIGNGGDENAHCDNEGTNASSQSEIVPTVSIERPVHSSDTSMKSDPKEDDFTAAAAVDNVDGYDADFDDLNVTGDGNGDENAHCNNEGTPPKMPNASPQTSASSPSEMFPIVATESSLHLSDTSIPTKTEKALPDPLMSSPDDQKRNRILIQGVYVEAKMKTIFEEILTENPNFLSAIRVTTAVIKTALVETAINSLQIIGQGGMSSEQLVYVKETLVDLAANGLDVAWIERLYQRERLVMDEQEVVLAEAELARLERETVEREEKLEASKALRDASKAKVDALKQGLEVRKEGGGFDSKRSGTSSKPMEALLAPFNVPYFGSPVLHFNSSDHLEEVECAAADEEEVSNNVDGSDTAYEVVNVLNVLGNGDGDETAECNNEVLDHSQVSHLEAGTSEGMDDCGLWNLSKSSVKFQEFRIIVNGSVRDSELSKHLQVKYYELCCTRKSYLHHRLRKGINHKLTAEIICETINIADAIRASNLSTSPDHLATWDDTLETFELLGMDTGFLRARLHRLLELNEASSRVEKEMESLKENAKQYKIMFQEEANAAW